MKGSPSLNLGGLGSPQQHAKGTRPSGVSASSAPAAGAVLSPGARAPPGVVPAVGAAPRAVSNLRGNKATGAAAPPSAAKPKDAVLNSTYPVTSLSEHHHRHTVKPKEVVLSTYREGGTLTDQYKALFTHSGSLKAAPRPKHTERSLRQAQIIEHYELHVATGGTDEEFVKNLSEADIEDIAEKGLLEDVAGAPSGDDLHMALAGDEVGDGPDPEAIVQSSVGIAGSAGGGGGDTVGDLPAPAQQAPVTAAVLAPPRTSSRPSSASRPTAANPAATPRTSRPSSAQGGLRMSKLGNLSNLNQLCKQQHNIIKTTRLLAMSFSQAPAHSAIPDIPDELIDDIAQGRCIVFIGAGFSAAAGLPDWRSLLGQLCEGLPTDFRDPSDNAVRNLRRDLLTQGGYDPRTKDEIAAAAEAAAKHGRKPEPPAMTESGLSPDMFASLLKNTYDYLAANILPEERRSDFDFGQAIHRCLQLPASLASDAQFEDMRARLDVLRAIPFRGIITTNFDGLLLGRTPFDGDIKNAYKSLLRPKDGASAHTEKFGGEPGCPLQHLPGKPIIQLHGRVGPDWARPTHTSASPGGAGFFPPPVSPSSRFLGVRPSSGVPSSSSAKNAYVFSKAEYNGHIHGNPVNSLFLRSVFSTCTVLFLGFSFTDNYVDDLLDETMHLFSRDEDQSSAPLSYAINADKFGPVGRSSVEIVKVARGVQFLLYEHDSRHTNFLKTLQSLKDKVDKRVYENRKRDASVTNAAHVLISRSRAVSQSSQKEAAPQSAEGATGMNL